MSPLCYLGGPIAQMNWGRMIASPGDPAIAEFEAELDRIFGLAEAHPGFIWRMSDADMARQIIDSGFDNRTSATVSVWRSYDDLKDYTYNSEHGVFLKRKQEWFDRVHRKQLVIWNVEADQRPDFFEAIVHLKKLESYGPTSEAFGWL